MCTKLTLSKAHAELIADGWTMVLTVMHSGSGLAYGTLYTKGGIRYYLNQDTLIASMSGPEMAAACKPIFNKVDAS